MFDVRFLRDGYKYHVTLEESSSGKLTIGARQFDVKIEGKDDPEFERISSVIREILSSPDEEIKHVKDRLISAEFSEVSFEEITLESVLNVLIENMKECKVPDASVALIKKGEIEGCEVHQNGAVEESAHLFQVASISKTVTTMAMLSLIQECREAATEGRPSRLVDSQIIDLDTDIFDIHGMEDFRDVIDPKGLSKDEAHKLTIQRLLSHTGGVNVPGFIGYPTGEGIEAIQYIIDDLKREKEKLQGSEKEEDIRRVEDYEMDIAVLQRSIDYSESHEGKMPTLDEVILGKGNTDQLQIVNAPGTKHEYSGGGTTLIQKAIEVLTNESFQRVVKERVFNPLGMNRSTYTPRKEDCISGHIGGREIPPEAIQFVESAAAGVWSTGEDLAKLAVEIQSALTGEGKVLSKGLAESMITPQVDCGDFAQEAPIQNGLGLFFHTEGLDTIFNHSGANTGFYSILIGKTTGDGIALIVNEDSDIFIRFLEAFPNFKLI